MGFSRQEYWSRLPFPSPGDLPDLGTKLESLALAGRFFTAEPPGKPPRDVYSPNDVASTLQSRNYSGCKEKYT